MNSTMFCEKDETFSKQLSLLLFSLAGSSAVNIVKKVPRLQTVLTHCTVAY